MEEREVRGGYLKAYESVAEARAGIGAYLRFYNSERPHQTPDYRTPAQVFEEGRNQVLRWTQKTGQVAK